MGLSCPSAGPYISASSSAEHNGPQLRARQLQSGGVGLHCGYIASNACARSIRSTKAAPLGSSDYCPLNSNCATMGAFRCQPRAGSHGSGSATAAPTGEPSNPCGSSGRVLSLFVEDPGVQL
ncbi:hypothetical protein L226DRAFT_96354 [Lentinus tigrinus ALCF2SS1-7]|uniref:uncharacterized protein n=1 Tax=Lentinus tigrinus ALCF2SS1-7 TaxID=1328758 RepID=UPI0011661F99|nr:hypothetical protein L226DRAFT_96354 [Lentinus tigrinus ALCF2SS1-7]